MPRETILKTIVVVLFLAVSSCESDDNPCVPPRETNDPVVVFETSMGDFAAVLYSNDAPKTVENFLRYVNEGFYDSLTIHRVIKNFIVQGGAYDENLVKKPAYDPIPNEANNGRHNLRGTIGMARTVDPHSATSQFFVNHVDNPNLDYVSPDRYGYCVFGSVIVGMDVVDSIAGVNTVNRDGHQDVPEVPIFLTRIYRGN
jgi:cyclophilin family peptidyl-prolyl cis-trans isomerase